MRAKVLHTLLKFVTVLLCSTGGVIQAHSALTIITEDWAPYNYQKGNQISGFSTEIVNAIINELDEQHSIEIYPGARGHMMLDKGPGVMYFSLFRTPEREHKYKWIGPISEEAIYFYKRQSDNNKYQHIDDIKNATVVVPHKGMITSQVEALGISDLMKISDRDRQFKIILAGRADLSANASPLGIAYYLKSLNFPVDALTQTEVKLLEFPLYIACSKDIPDEVINRWQNALNKIKASGEYQKIYNRYLN